MSLLILNMELKLCIFMNASRVATCTQSMQLRKHCQRREQFKMFKSAIKH